MARVLNVRHLMRVKRKKTTICADCDRACLNGQPAVYFCVLDREFGNGIPYGLYICPACFAENVSYRKEAKHFYDRHAKNTGQTLTQL